jgi:hypothetical protein
MAADPGARAELGGAALDHAPGVDAVHSRYGLDPTVILVANSGTGASRARCVTLTHG